MFIKISKKVMLEKKSTGKNKQTNKQQQQK